MSTSTSSSSPQLTLINLENSRAFRVAWLLEELGLPYENKVFNRINGKKAPAEMRDSSGTILNKSPVLIDHGLKDKPFDKPITVWESAGILQYIVDRYAPTNSALLPSPHTANASTFSWQHRQDVLAWLNFSESLMLHSLAVVYTRWFAREEVPGDQECKVHLEEEMSGNVVKDLDAIEEQLKSNRSSNGGQGELFLVGKELTLADIMMAFSTEYVITSSAGTANKRWPTIEQWLQQLEARPAYQMTLQNGAAHRFVLKA